MCVVGGGRGGQQSGGGGTLSSRLARAVSEGVQERENGEGKGYNALVISAYLSSESETRLDDRTIHLVAVIGNSAVCNALFPHMNFRC